MCVHVGTEANRSKQEPKRMLGIKGTYFVEPNMFFLTLSYPASHISRSQGARYGSVCWISPNTQFGTKGIQAAL